MNMPQGQGNLDAMKAEMIFVADLFNKMSEMCFKKCVPRFHDGDLNTGEPVVCADRCVGKYVEATNKVGEVMQQLQQGQAPQ
ncbi:Mitochondrial import inner membrane translocase subunit TIM10 [Gracilariopsis chorda]|uniref:Mitochondrial import inner membrane translocase subunit n=1 Tax=Gracilariopsis chorda TaxID=448386 RepID=A0A2V3IR05_9FLOR|nr:Mitochondrial import inner membrane translocase subunit TIM10 [Gracilariopsis chorda]|eukprot:PXF44546.1 Mitochondrial import inner membrane translocase subunit TIM10 [Gracilariopsis chorda]